MQPPHIPELVKRKAEHLLAEYCRQRIDRLKCPHVVIDQCWDDTGVQLSCRDGCNPPWPIVRFQYASEFHQWFLFSPAENGRWRPCLEVRSTLDFERLLFHLDRDPFRVFWPRSFTCFS
ncbi:MAG: DUF3024 domain-containing protein [Deltaproteobacteria bacterium]|nr:DUF3024 domain-containing protein [Deltaproteobacteria bacterium]